jgi:ribose transport system permease protein
MSTEARGEKRSGAGHLLSRWLATPEASVGLVLLLLLVFMAARGMLGTFFQPFNVESVSRSISLQGIFAVGELLVILTGGIDLSVGSLIAFSGMLLAAVMGRLADGGTSVGAATAVGIFTVLGFALLLGVLHAALVHYLRLPPFVVTLASMSVLRSAALLLNNSVPIPIQRFELITFLGNRKLFIAGTGIGLPVSTVILIVIAVVMIAILQLTRIGRRVYAVGSNEEASRLSGVDVFKVRAFVYGTCSLLAGIAGILYAGYSAQGDPQSANMFELNAISAVVIGGAVLTGGRGSVIGTILGAMLLETILSMINLTLSNPTLWRGMVVGGVLLLAVVFNQVRLIWSARRRAGVRAG